MLQNNESRFIPTHPAPEDGVQVGGHGGKGALIISGDKCKKPCASKELKFYEATQAEGPIKMYHDAHLIPQFYGVEQKQVDGETVNYVVMENLTFGFNKYAPTKKGESNSSFGFRSLCLLVLMLLTAVKFQTGYRRFENGNTDVG